RFASRVYSFFLSFDVKQSCSYLYGLSDSLDNFFNRPSNRRGEFSNHFIGLNFYKWFVSRNAFAFLDEIRDYLTLGYSFSYVMYFHFYQFINPPKVYFIFFL